VLLEVIEQVLQKIKILKRLSYDAEDVLDPIWMILFLIVLTRYAIQNVASFFACAGQGAALFIKLNCLIWSFYVNNKQYHLVQKILFFLFEEMEDQCFLKKYFRVALILKFEWTDYVGDLLTDNYPLI